MEQTDTYAHSIDRLTKLTDSNYYLSTYVDGSEA